ncbi:MAG: tetratricopeptide repeat protein [Blastocatellia bacterium]|nr:tetratricopeptide repeat protein [Blastocatellia bacterium]
MKRCPECRRDYYDDTLAFCLEDGTALLQGSVPSPDEPQTAILHETTPPAEAATRAQIHMTDQTAVLPAGTADVAAKPRGFDKRLIAAPLLAILIAVGGYFGYRYLGPFGSTQINSIAVMPFTNESGNPDVEYLSDGMTETLIGSLTKVPDLNVKARSSVFRYKGKETDAKTLGSELNVQAILNGRVAQRGDQLTVSLELVDVATENAIWSQQYTRKQTDLVSLQSEIARDVSNNLKSRLSGADVAKVQRTYTVDPEAYQLYLKGRFQWNRRTGESLKQAAAFFEQAIAKDPNYALAYSALAETYVLFPNYSVAQPMDCMPKAKAAALRAIELDDSLAEAHVALGIYYSNFAWNLPASEKEFRRAIELNPNYAYAHHQFGIECLSAAGRFDEAIAAGKRAEELDPVSPIIGADLGLIFIRARRFDEAIAQLNQVAALDPDFWVTSWYLGFAYYGKKQYAEAVAAHRKALAGSDHPFAKALLIQSLVKAGQRGEAAELLAALQSESERRYVSSSGLAIAYGALGEKDKAFLILEKEVAERASRPIVFSLFVIWDDLRDDPRFAALIRKVEQSRLD